MQPIRQPSAGPQAGSKGVITIPETAIAASTGATLTTPFTGAVTGSVVALSFRAAPGNNASVVFSDAFVSASGVLTLRFGNTGAAATISAATIDALVYGGVGPSS